MRTRDLFTNNRSAKKINESIQKVFGRKLNLENFDLAQLEDARNKLRTQLHTERSKSGFNETIENEALTQAQWMLDAINSEIVQRESIAHADDEMQNEYFHYGDKTKDKNSGHDELARRQKVLGKGGLGKDGQYGGEYKKKDKYGDAYKIAGPKGKLPEDKDMPDDVADFIARGGKIQQIKPKKTKHKPGMSLASKHIGGGGEKNKASRNGLGANTQGSAVIGLGRKKTESIIATGEYMRRVTEGEIQQASAIVTAKTMVDRVGRWIEELSGMENDTLLQLGDSIRDEMGQEQAKVFIEAVAPAIQTALENLKNTRDTLSASVRSLATGEQPDNMLGAEPEMDSTAPDAMNSPDMGDDINFQDPAADDEFGASDAAVGGAEAAGREKRESIDYGNRLLKVLAG
jgi:hypothetical protein